MVVATDKNNKVITLREYKHGSGKVQLTLPAGMLDHANEPLAKTARRELEEETGFTGGTFKYLGCLYDYSSKDMHKVHIFRAKNVVRKLKQKLEDTETIIQVNLFSIQAIKKQIKSKEWDTTHPISALALSGLLF
jgi:8-oxo-dGTP pyrophosphatase MutT (NUDIX family)